MNTFNNRLLEFIKHNCLNDSEFANSVEIEKATISRIRKNEIKSPKISLLQKVVEVYQLNPYKVYELLTGEVYTEKPQGSVTAELEALKKENNELKKRVERYLKIIENFSENIYLTSPGTGTGRSVVELGKTATTQHIINSLHTQQEEIYGVPVEVEKEKPPDQALH